MQEDENKIRKRGAKPKYFTEEERKIANREKTKRYYQRNKDR
jgi:hypothetical protein